MTVAERILARASGGSAVGVGGFVTAKIDKLMCHEALGAVYGIMRKNGLKKIQDPERVVVVLDHYAPPPTERAAEIHKLVRAAVRDLGITHFYDLRGGVGHQVMVEKGHVLPGELVVSSDSHTTMYGALGAASCGIGFSEMTYALCTGSLWFRIPETVRYVMKGKLQPMVASKDVMLSIAGRFSSEAALYKSIEFDGPLVADLDMDGRFTMSNMAVEIGAKFGFFQTDEVTEGYLAGRAKGHWEPVRYDRGASDVETHEIDVTGLSPQVALPHSVDNVVAVSGLDRIEIHQAVLGSCTNGRLGDLRTAASLLKGKSVHPSVRLLVIPASTEIYREAMGSGILEILSDAGGIILNPGCGPCFGAHMGLLASGERCISTTNRNFRGRMGSDGAEVYLASPATVAVSALRGVIADPREA